MRHPLEKPLIPICGKAMVERVLSAIRGSRMVDRIIVVISPNTPKTAERIRSRGEVELIEALGEGYIEDMKYVIKRERLDTVLVVSADLPLITPELIDYIISEYDRCRKPALMVAVRNDFYERLGFYSNCAYSQKYDPVIPAGINVLNGGKIDEEEMEEEVLVLDRTEIAANINTQEDLRRVKELIEDQECEGGSVRNKTRDTEMERES